MGGGEQKNFQDIVNRMSKMNDSYSITVLSIGTMKKIVIAMTHSEAECMNFVTI